MSFYNMLFGKNPMSGLLLAVIGLREHDVERFRDCGASEDGSVITVYTRTGGGNRSSYPQLVMRKRPEWSGSCDDDFDSTYCTDTFNVPEQWHADVVALADIFANGLRKEFGLHLCETLRRTPTEADLAATAYDQERTKLARAKHELANGHTFVPLNDQAMELALECAEANGGTLRTCWGILPLKLEVVQGREAFDLRGDSKKPQHEQSIERGLVRVPIGKWSIDTAYLDHCRAKFTEKYPLAMARIVEQSAKHDEQDIGKRTVAV